MKKRTNFWSIKNSTEILNTLKAKGFQASSVFEHFILRDRTI